MAPPTVLRWPPKRPQPNAETDLNMALLELRNVSKIYHLGGEEIRALDDVSLDLDQGEFVSIIGPSGSGKSTLMHILGCLASPTRGSVVLGGFHGRCWKIVMVAVKANPPKATPCPFFNRRRTRAFCAAAPS